MAEASPVIGRTGSTIARRRSVEYAKRRRVLRPCPTKLLRYIGNVPRIREVASLPEFDGWAKSDNHNRALDGWFAGRGGGDSDGCLAFFSANRNTEQPAASTESQKPVSSAPIAEITAKSIAVLPFESLSPNKDDTYFADGVQDEILNNLAKIAQLTVISRTSVMQYRADQKRDLRQIANSLGVANVLEGTVRRNGNRVRISTELIDARQDKTTWADSFDRDLTDIFAIQSEIAQMIASKLAATLSSEEKQNIEKKPTENLEAYDLYLRAKKLLVSVQVSMTFGGVKKPLVDAANFLE